SCRHLAEHGYAVSFLDRRGSGAAETDRGDCPNFRRLGGDGAEVVAKIPRALPRRNVVVPGPVVLSGSSWGGKLAVALERRHAGMVDGLVLMAPGFFPKLHHTFAERLQIFASRWFTPRKLFPIPLNEPELFTTTPKWLEYLKNDPHRLHF